MKFKVWFIYCKLVRVVFIYSVTLYVTSGKFGLLNLIFHGLNIYSHCSCAIKFSLLFKCTYDGYFTLL